ncbi:MAG: hypothetical protein JST04_00285 [Bdellovibrionales bacterium]|nr:hypothetical protein [Bdellovibrionales bacterium]
MIIRVNKNFKDDSKEKPHRSYTRRDFLAKGLAAGTATALLPHSLVGSLIKDAVAATTCPPQVRQPGALAQIFRNGGPANGAAFIHQIQASGMTSAAATFHGVIAGDLVKVGTNWYVSKTSPFGIALLTPPAGYTAASWTATLAKTSLGGHFGAFAADDGAGDNLGNLGSASGFKTTSLGKDVRVNVSNNMVDWAKGYPAVNVNVNVDQPSTGLTPTSIANRFGMTPAANTSPALVTNAATAADSLSSIFANVFNLGGRKYGAQAVSKAVCGFYGSAGLATNGIGQTLFDPTKITALASSTIKPAMLSASQQALFSAFYQSAIGSIAGVVIQQNGCDYHQATDDPDLLTKLQDSVSTNDYEAGVYVAMFIAACDAAATPGSLISVANGNCGNTGTVDVTVPGPGVAAKCPNTLQADTGGTFSAGYLLCFHPSTPPNLLTTGTFNASNGSVKAATTVFSVPAAMAGLYLTAFKYLGLDMNGAAAAMAATGINNPTSLMVI